jgi:hypothetical protein
MQRSSEQNQAKIDTVIFISHLIEKKERLLCATTLRVY